MNKSIIAIIVVVVIVVLGAVIYTKTMKTPAVEQGDTTQTGGDFNTQPATTTTDGATTQGTTTTR